MSHRPARLVSALLGLGLATTLLPATLPRPAVAQQSGAAPTQTSGAIPCSQSPFGAALELGREQELFLGFAVADNTIGGRVGGYRFDYDPSGDLIREQALIDDPNPNRAPITGRASTVADLNGDGRGEFVQAFSDGGAYRLLVNRAGAPLTTFTDDAGAHSEWAIAAGDVVGADDRREQVAVASRSPSGALTVQLFEGTDAGEISSKIAIWRSTIENRSQPTKVAIAVGNFDGDEFMDIAVAFQQATGAVIQLVFLEYLPGAPLGSGDNFAQNLIVRAKTSFPAVLPGRLRLAAANVDGSGGDEIVLAYAQRDGSPITVVAFSPDGNGSLVRQATQQFGGGRNAFAMATGDLDGPQGGVSQEEVVLAFDGSGAFGFPEGLAYNVVRLEGSAFNSVAYFADGNNGRSQVSNLDIVVADTNRDNRGEIVAAYSDTSPLGFQLSYLRYTGGQTIRLVSSERFDASFNAPPDLAAADWDNNSLRAMPAAPAGQPQNRCELLTERQIVNAIFVPPHWQNIQGDVEKEATFGESLANEESFEKSYEYTSGSAVSAYLGAEVGAEIPNIAEFSAAVKATVAYEYSSGKSRGTSQSRITTKTTGFAVSDDGVIYQEGTYRCYTYRVFDGAQALPLDQAGVRLCDFMPIEGASGGIALLGSDLDSWDKLNRAESEYAPVARDWASVALFRGPNTAQSSNSATAALAVDSEITNGSFAGATVAETSLGDDRPWWQVDLGQQQPISKIRLWAPPQGLADFVLLVSNNDFQAMPNHDDPANLVGRPDVRAYSMADLGLPANAPAGEVTTFVTLSSNRPIMGRFVRVHRRDNAALRLGEVQVFGTNHVEPDRYPAAVADADTNDGHFEVLMLNPFNQNAQEWKKVRGQLQWGGASNQQIGLLFAARGANAGVSWSMSTSTVSSTITSASRSTNASIGVEFEVEAGSAVKVLAGSGYSRTSGVAEETTRTISWEQGLDMGGSLPNFPSEYSNAEQGWSAICRYGTRPFFYITSDQSSLGFRHDYTVLDYVVPVGNSLPLLNRGADLSNCRNGNLLSTTPTGTPDQSSTTTGAAQSFAVLANDQGQDLSVTGVGPASNGTTSFSRRSVTYSPSSGFVGQDSFEYTVTDAAGQSTTSRVTVEVKPIRVFLPGVRR